MSNDTAPSVPGQHAKPPTSYDQDEIDLFDLWLVLARRKWLIACVVVFVVGLTAVWLLSRTPIYQATATLDTGRFGGHPLACGGNQPVTSGDSILTCSDALADLEPAPDATPTAGHPRLSGVEWADTGLTIRTRGISASEARDLAARLTEERLASFRAHYRMLQSDTQRRLASIGQRLQHLEASSGRMGIALKDSDVRSNPGAYGLTLLSSVQATNLQLELEDRRRELERTAAISSPPKLLVLSAPTEPAEPNFRMAGALAIVLAFMLAIFAAFLAEFLAGVRQRLPSVRRD